MFDDVEERPNNDDTGPSSKVNNARHPSSLLPSISRASEDVCDLRRPQDEQGRLEAAGNGRDDDDTCVASDILEELHGHDWLCRVAVYLIENE